uniref:Uncharacterized protein ycf23 n=1 Tax=Liagora brachyclada TaxID=1884665 RepID=A0A1G4NZS2_9FLOR|nr:Hypothetical protein ycf23 [Liagora brachyclada]SCW24160.1 Hypothetical protein ycf23 [Liagora brachyclada]
MVLNYSIQKACNKKQVLKTIIGIDNFHFSSAIEKIKAAEVGGSTYIDIAANVNILLEVKSLVSLPVCVSSICIQELEQCYNAGADMLELGNFDIFYDRNISLTETNIIAMARQLKHRLPEASICVTIPHILNINQQIILAKSLEDIGIDMIQTEGLISKQTNTSCTSSLLSKASATLGHSAVLSNNVTIPVIASSGISPLTAPVAIACGAAGVGIGSFFNNFQALKELSQEIKETAHMIQLASFLNYSANSSTLSVDRSSILSKV